jgi:hypothetical protein
MGDRAFRKIPLAASVLLLSACALGARAAPASLSDAQVVRDLAARDEGKASRAVREVLARGGRMIPHLLKLKGDRRCFRGDVALGSHAGCSFRLMPEKDEHCYEAGSSSTVEVAALFLIEAVYRDDLKFAQGATLIERDTDGQQRLDVEYNGRQVIARAWAEAERWFAEFERDGLEALRAKGRGPFAGTRLGFF